MRFNSKALWIIAALLVIGLLVDWWIESESNRELFIALPFVKPINEITTLEWEPVKVTRPESGSDGSEHPGYTLAKAH